MEVRVHKKTNELASSKIRLQMEIDERKTMESDFLEMTQEEHRRFGSQLHDGLCQELTAILIFAKSLSKKMERDKTLQQTELQKISDMLLEAVDQVRKTARGLYPGDLDSASLLLSLKELAEHTTEAKCTFRHTRSLHIKNSNVATHLYRIVQEGISNSVQHGRPKHIEILLSQRNEYVTLTITDDGVGMPSQPKKQVGIGLKIMKYRARMINASFLIKARVPTGVIIECRFKQTPPLQDSIESTDS
jgi:signal transduction histidine kinase